MVRASLWLLCLSGSAFGQDFEPLFKPESFDGFHAFARPLPDGSKPDPWTAWSIKDGVITCAGKPVSFLATKVEYDNYTLRLKWKYPADALTRVKRPNSGVLVHVNGPDKVWPLSIEVQLANGDAGDLWTQEDVNQKFPTLEVIKDRHDPKQSRRFVRMCGDAKHYEKPLGEWNQYEITCQGGAIRVKVNGENANEATDGSLKKGRIGFQAEGVEIQFKDVEIKKLK